MTTELASEMMTTEEAHAAAEEIRRLTESFKRNLARLRTLVLEFDERKGWAALGHNTIEECARERFGWSPSQFWRQLTAGKIDRAAGLDVGTTPTRGVRRPATISQGNVAPCNVSLPESCAVANNPPEASANGAPTAEKVRQAVERIEQPAPLPQSVIPPSVSAVPTQTVTMGDTPAVTQSEPKKITPSAPASDLGEIDLAVLRDAGITIGQAVGAVARIASVARLGGLSWEKRVDVACRLNVK